MSISSISFGASPSYQADLSELFKQRKQDFKAIENAVESGDLASAKQAVTAFQQDRQQIQNARSTTGGQGQSSQQNSQFKIDVDAFISSIQSGNLAGSQTALQTLQHNRQLRSGNTLGQNQGNFKSDLRTLFQAVQSGDLTSAQQSLSAVQADKKTSGMGYHRHHGGGGNGRDIYDHDQANMSSVNTTLPVTGSSHNSGASIASANSIQSLLNNLVNSVAQAAYTNTVGIRATSSLLSIQA